MNIDFYIPGGGASLSCMQILILSCSVIIRAGGLDQTKTEHHYCDFHSVTAVGVQGASLINILQFQVNLLLAVKTVLVSLQE